MKKFAFNINSVPIIREVSNSCPVAGDELFASYEEAKGAYLSHLLSEKKKLTELIRQIRNRKKLVPIHWDYEYLGEYEVNENDLSEGNRVKRKIAAHFKKYREDLNNQELYLCIGERVVDWDIGIIEFKVTHWGKNMDGKKAMNNFTLKIKNWKNY